MTLTEVLPRQRVPVEQGTPTGQFVYPYVEIVGHPDNKVTPGETIQLRAHYQGECPGQPWYAPEWTVSVVAYDEPLTTILGKNDTTHFTEGPVTNDPTLYAGTMPSYPIWIGVVLWGNPSGWKPFPEDGGDWTQLDFRWLYLEPKVAQYTLSTSVSPAGSGYIIPSSGVYDDGEWVTITAYAYSGYEFDHWGGDASGTSRSITITMDGNKSIIAYFTEIQVGWQLLDTDWTNVGATIPGWQFLDSASVVIRTAISVWQLLHSRTVTVGLAAPPTVGWEVLDTKTTTVKPAPAAVGWEPLNEHTSVLTAGPPEEVWELVSHKVYDRAKAYVGTAEECTFEFKLTPEQIPGTEWMGIAIANAFADEVTKQGSEMLDLKVYEDTTPTLWTNFRVVATATVPEGEGVANPLPWAIIIVAVLAILFVVALTFLIREIKTIDWGKPAQAIPMALIIGGVVVLAGVGVAMAVRKKTPVRSLTRY